jgi:hypothetical protein
MSREIEYMPLMRTGLAIRMDLLNEQQAQRNHGQTLTRLKERGGLSPCEVLAIAEHRVWKMMRLDDCMQALQVLADNTKPLPEPIGYAHYEMFEKYMLETGTASMACKKPASDNGYKIPLYAEPIVRKREEIYSDALRSLASYVGCGGYNAGDPIDAKAFEDKIRYGIDLLIAAQSHNSETPARNPLSDDERQILETLERICEGITQDHIDGGFTVTGLSRYAKDLEEEIKQLKSEPPARKALTQALLIERWQEHVSRTGEDEPLMAFIKGARFAEEKHGITNPEQSKPKSNAI